MSQVSKADGIGIKVVRAAGLVSIASGIGYIISFIKAAMVAAYLGTGLQMDVFLWGFAIISFFSTFVSNPLISVMVPVYLSLKTKGSKVAKEYFEVIHTWLFIAFGILSILLVLIVPFVVRLIGHNIGQEGINLAYKLILMMIPVVLFSGVWTACQSILNAESSFFLPTLMNSLNTLMVIVVLWIGGRDKAVFSQAIGLSIGAFLQWFLLFIVLWYKGLRFRLRVNLRTDGVDTTIKLLWPLVITQALILLLPIVDRTIATRYSSGVISALGYAQTLMMASVTLFLTALQVSVLPFFSQQVVDEGLHAFGRTYISTIRLLVTLFLPLSIFLIVVQEPIIRLVFERGAFDAQATALTAPAFAAYLVGVVPMALTFISSRGFNAIQDSWTNAIIGTGLLVTIKLIANSLFTSWWGYIGLAYATSVAYLATALVMLFVMGLKLGHLDGPQLIRVFIKALIISVVIGILARLGMFIGKDNALFELGLAGSFAVIGFLLSSYVLKVEDVFRLWSLVIKIFKKQQVAMFPGDVLP